MTTKINLILDQGADFSATFNLTTANGDILDLSSYTGASQIRKTYTSNTAINFNVNLTSNGNVEISLTSAVTANIAPGRYSYDVEITSPSNVVSRIIEGIIDVSPNMTR